MLYVLIMSLLWAYGCLNQLLNWAVKKGKLSVSGSASGLDRLSRRRPGLMQHGERSGFTHHVSENQSGNLHKCHGSWEASSGCVARLKAETVSQWSCVPWKNLEGLIFSGEADIFRKKQLVMLKLQRFLFMQHGGASETPPDVLHRELYLISDILSHINCIR